MEVNFSVKQLGKKRPYIDRLSLEIEGNYGQSYPLKRVLSAIIRQQIDAFNQRKQEKNLLGFLKEDDVAYQAEHGKVGFGASYNNQEAQPDTAIEAVLQAFEDGIVAVFLDDNQLDSLESEISLQPASLFTFVRLTFLAGSFW